MKGKFRKGFRQVINGIEYEVFTMKIGLKKILIQKPIEKPIRNPGK